MIMDEQGMVNEAQKRYMEFLPTLLVAFPQLSNLEFNQLKSLKHVAVISKPTIKTNESLRDYIARRLSEDKSYTFNDKSNFVVHVPTGILGSSIYVVFEI